MNRILQLFAQFVPVLAALAFTSLSTSRDAAAQAVAGPLPGAMSRTSLPEGVIAQPEFCAPEFPPQLRLTPPQTAAEQAPPDLGRPPGTVGQTLADLTPWLVRVQNLFPDRVTTRVLGHSLQGRPLIAVEVSPPGPTSTSWHRLAVLCRQHGDEPEATASGARFLGQWLAARAPACTRNTQLLLIVVANPDGAAIGRRHDAANLDLNRDWGRFASVEVPLLAKALVRWHPQLVVDVHQWDPSRHMPPSMAEASGGWVALYAANTMARGDAAHGLALQSRGRWGLDTLCHRWFGQREHIPAILLESRHMPTVKGARETAIKTTVTALWSACHALESQPIAVHP